MIVSIFTPTPQFANDMADVVRVFFGNIDLRINESGGELALTHTESVAGDARQCRIEASGVCAAQAESVRPLYADALEEKRIHKRQLKQGVYAVMKQITGRTPPWGSLTGIRPGAIRRAVGKALPASGNRFRADRPAPARQPGY